MRPPIDFVYSVSSRLKATSPVSAELTCTEVRRIRVCLPGDETTGLSLPEQTIVHHKCFIPIDTKQNIQKVCKIMLRFGVNNHVCSIVRQMNEAINSESLQKRGVIEVKIWKIITRSHVMDRATERFLIERYCYDSPVINSLQVLGHSGSKSKVEEEKGCVICMEDYEEGAIVAGMPCNHDFHGDCINKWLQINRHCPLCRFNTSH